MRLNMAGGTDPRDDAGNSPLQNICTKRQPAPSKYSIVYLGRTSKWTTFVE